MESNLNQRLDGLQNDFEQKLSNMLIKREKIQMKSV